MGGVIDTVKAKVDKGWTITKKTVAMLSVWGLVFSLVTVSKLAVAFDYDDTLVFSAPAFRRGFAKSTQAFSPDFWAVVNQSYDLEKPKLLTYPLAWAFRIFGFRVTVLTARPPVEADALKKEWRHLISRGNFIFAGDESAKQGHLASGNYILYFGDSDTDIEVARRARVFPIRVRRSNKSVYKEDYNPGTLGELVIPFSEFSL